MSRNRLLLAVFLRATIAVQLSELFETSDFDKQLFPKYIHTFFDGTVLVSATSNVVHDELALHPIVTVPDPSPPHIRINETLLLAHVYPQNQTIAWATAITTIRANEFVSTVDPAGNVYVVGEGRGGILAIKYSFSGRRLYEVRHAPPLHRLSEREQYRFAQTKRGTDSLFYLASGKLLVPATARTRMGYRRPAFLTLNAFSGDFLEITRFPLPKEAREIPNDPDDFAVVRDTRKNRRSHVACYLFRAPIDVNWTRGGLFLQCAAVKGKRRIVTRLVDRSNVFDTLYFSHLAAEKEPPSNRAPSMFIAHTVFRNWTFSAEAPTAESNPKHELVLSRLDTSGLSRVDWASGGRGKTTKPLVVRFAIPPFPDFVTDASSVQHLRETNSVALLLRTSHKFVETKLQEKPGEGITIVGGGEHGGVYRSFFDRQQRFWTTRLVEGDPRTKRPSNRIDLADMAFSLDERCAYMFGYLGPECDASGPLYIYNTSNPITSKSIAC